MKAWYSLIQYCPDASRLEAANVGVVLLCPEAGFLKACMTSNNDRVRRFFGSEALDAKRLRAMRDMLSRRFATEAAAIRGPSELETFGTRFANELTISPPRSVSVQSPEQSLGELFDELVRCAPEEELAREHSDAQVIHSIEREFRSAGIESYLRRKVSITLDKLDQEVEIPFAYKNGRWNFLQSARFSHLTEHNLRSAVYGKAYLARVISQHEFADYGTPKITVVGSIANQGSRLLGVIKDAFKEVDANFYTTDELPAVAEHIRKTAHALS